MFPCNHDSNFAKNLFASSCDNRRPIIAFGVCRSILRSGSWPSAVAV
jgi:hypothetical protein